MSKCVQHKCKHHEIIMRLFSHQLFLVKDVVKVFFFFLINKFTKEREINASRNDRLF